MKCSRRGFLTSKDNPVYPIWPNGKIQTTSWFKGSVFPWWSVWRAVRELVEGKMPVFTKSSKSLQGKVRRVTLLKDGSVLPRPAWRTVGELESSSGNKGGVPPRVTHSFHGDPHPPDGWWATNANTTFTNTTNANTNANTNTKNTLRRESLTPQQQIESTLNPQNKQIQKGIQNYRIQMQIYKYKNTNRRVGGHPLLLTKSAPAGWNRK